MGHPCSIKVEKKPRVCMEGLSLISEDDGFNDATIGNVSNMFLTLKEITPYSIPVMFMIVYDFGKSRGTVPESGRKSILT